MYDKIKMVIFMDQLFVLYTCILCVLSVVLTVIDKDHARRGKIRISENALLTLAALGGATIMYITMLLIRHKTKHKKFMLLLPLMIVIHIAILYFVLNQIQFRAE